MWTGWGWQWGGAFCACVRVGWCVPDRAVPCEYVQAHDIAAGMLYLHTRSTPIVHRDLKAANCFVNQHYEASRVCPALCACHSYEGIFAWAIGTFEARKLRPAPPGNAQLYDPWWCHHTTMTSSINRCSHIHCVPCGAGVRGRFWVDQAAVRDGLSRQLRAGCQPAAVGSARGAGRGPSHPAQ